MPPKKKQAKKEAASPSVVPSSSQNEVTSAVETVTASCRERLRFATDEGVLPDGATSYHDLVQLLADFFLLFNCRNGNDQDIIAQFRAQKQSETALGGSDEDDEDCIRAAQNAADRLLLSAASRKLDDESVEGVSGCGAFSSLARLRESQERVFTMLVFSGGLTGYLSQVPLSGAQGDSAKTKAAVLGKKRPRSSSQPGAPSSLKENTEALGRFLASCHQSTMDLKFPPEVAPLLGQLIAIGEERLPAFMDDAEFLSAKQALYVQRETAMARRTVSNNTSVMAMCRSIGIDYCASVVPCASLIAEVLERHIAARLRKTRELVRHQEGKRIPFSQRVFLPRVLRVAAHLELSEKETEALTYILLCHCGGDIHMRGLASLKPAGLSYFCGLTPKELMHFLKEDRTHMAQGLLTSDIKLRTSFADCRYSIPETAVVALSGADLTAEQMIKLEKTAVVDVLEAENRFKDDDDDGSDNELGGSGKRNKKKEREKKRDTAENEEDEAGSESGSDGGDSDEEVDVSNLTAEQVKEMFGCDEAQAQGILAAVANAPPGYKLLFEGKLGKKKSSKKAKARKELEAPEDGDNDISGSLTQQQQQAGAGESAAFTSVSLGEIDPFNARPILTSNGGAEGDGKPAKKNLEAMMNKPYANDIEYLSQAFRVLADLVKSRCAEGDIKDEEDNSFVSKSKLAANLRELRGKVRVNAALHKSRVEATLRAAAEAEAAAAKSPASETTAKRTAPMVPRIEALAQKLGLCELEKQIVLLMVGNLVSHDIVIAIHGNNALRGGFRILLTVGYMLFVLCNGLQECVVARQAFFQSSKLLSNGIITMSLNVADNNTTQSRFNTDLMDYVCDIDRKIVDHLMGTETETAEMVPGSRLYHPTVPLHNVALPRDVTEKVLSTIQHYGLFERCRRACGFGEGLGLSSAGLVMLFYGPSGTGKTMLANAVAHELGKKILLVNVSQFGGNASETLRFVFREAKLSDAIIFFDECEALFQKRDANPLVTSLLSEFERYEGLIMLATNKAQDMDEAMNRRISLMIEFKPPDHKLREVIWRTHLPTKHLAVADDVSLERLALNYELTGGLIRNAVLSALSHAVAAAQSDHPVLHMADLEHGAKLQLRGFFMAAGGPAGAATNELYLTPRRGLEQLIAEDAVTEAVARVAAMAKSRSTLFSQWGFSEDDSGDCHGALYLFHGPAGSGKSLAAEGIAYECGAAIRLCNVAELLLLNHIKLHEVFEEGRRLGAILVFDQAQGLFDHSEAALQVSQLMQYHAVRYPRPVIVIATTGDGNGERTSIDASASRLLFTGGEIHFALPRRPLRERLWRRAFPDKVPLGPDVDVAALSERVCSAKTIRTVAFNVCCQLALRPQDGGVVTMKMIELEMEAVQERERSRNPNSNMFV